MVVFGGVLLFQNRAQSTLPALSYQLPSPASWQRDLDVEVDMIGPEHYYFEKNEDIDLNIVPIEDDLAESLRTRGLEQFLQDILLGKNMINRIFDVDDVVLLSHELTQQNGAQVLRIRTTQRVEEEQLQIEEKYFIYPGQAVNFQLRWSQNANADQLRRAQQAFEQISMQSRSSLSR